VVCESSWVVVFFQSKGKYPWRRRHRMMAEEEAAEDSHDHSSYVHRAIPSETRCS
jgi:hypothetical protein